MKTFIVIFAMLTVLGACKTKQVVNHTTAMVECPPKLVVIEEEDVAGADLLIKIIEQQSPKEALQSAFKDSSDLKVLSETERVKIIQAIEAVNSLEIKDLEPIGQYSFCIEPIENTDSYIYIDPFKDRYFKPRYTKGKIVPNRAEQIKQKYTEHWVSLCQTDEVYNEKGNLFQLDENKFLLHEYEVFYVHASRYWIIFRTTKILEYHESGWLKSAIAYRHSFDSLSAAHRDTFDNFWQYDYVETSLSKDSATIESMVTYSIDMNNIEDSEVMDFSLDKDLVIFGMLAVFGACKTKQVVNHTTAMVECPPRLVVIEEEDVAGADLLIKVIEQQSPKEALQSAFKDSCDLKVLSEAEREKIIQVVEAIHSVEQNNLKAIEQYDFCIESIEDPSSYVYIDPFKDRYFKPQYTKSKIVPNRAEQIKQKYTEHWVSLCQIDKVYNEKGNLSQLDENKFLLHEYEVFYVHASRYWVILRTTKILEYHESGWLKSAIAYRHFFDSLLAAHRDTFDNFWQYDYVETSLSKDSATIESIVAYSIVLNGIGSSVVMDFSLDKDLKKLQGSY